LAAAVEFRQIFQLECLNVDWPIGYWVAYRAAMTISRERKVRFTCGLLLHVALACYSTTFEIPKFGNSHRILVDLNSNVDGECWWKWDVQLTQNPCDRCTDACWLFAHTQFNSYLLPVGPTARRIITISPLSTFISRINVGFHQLLLCVVCCYCLPVEFVDKNNDVIAKEYISTWTS